jgi:hypothetical protein
MTTNNEQFLMDKEDFVLNILSLGIAVQILEKLTGDSRDNLSNYIAQEALNQIGEFTPGDIEQSIEGYFQAKSTQKGGVAQVNITTGEFKFNATA